MGHYKYVLLFFLASAVIHSSFGEPDWKAPGEVSLDTFLSDTNWWTSSPSTLSEALEAMGFEWTISNETARAAHDDLNLLGLKVWEALIRFSSGSARQLTFQFYNRGDAGSLTSVDFEALLKKCNTALSQWAGNSGTALPEIKGPANIKTQHKGWVKANKRLELEWSYTPPRKDVTSFRAEYIRLRVAPGQSTPTATAANSLNRVSMTVFDTRAHLQKDPGGDVFLKDVPMVDQGQKGYCAAAVIERILRYYGQDFDQHQVAQLANTSDGGGTTPENTVNALRRIAAKMKLNVRVLNDFEFNDFERLLKDYNRLAVKADKPEVMYGHVIIVSEIYNQMETALLKEARLKRSMETGKFKTDITENINLGVPLIWSVMLGKIQENPEIPIEGAGGHLRLIIGYNAKTNEILYSDTWGAGHELKRLSLADAWTITTGLYTAKPVNIR